MEGYEKLKLGTEENKKLEQKDVTIVGLGIRELDTKAGKSEVLTLSCKHPDQETPIVISRAKVLRNEKIEENGLWIKKGPENTIPASSTIGLVMKYYHCEVVEQLEGKTVQTVADEKGYLCIKAY